MSVFLTTIGSLGVLPVDDHLITGFMASGGFFSFFFFFFDGFLAGSGLRRALLGECEWGC